MSSPQAHGWEFWFGVALSSGLLAWICKAAYQRLRGRVVAGKQWIAAMNAVRADVDGIKKAMSVALDPSSPDGIKAWIGTLIGGLNAKVDSLTKGIESCTRRLAINHGIQCAILNRAEEPVVTFCYELKMVFANKAALKLFGVSSFDELRDHNWKDRLEFATVERAEIAMRKAAEEHRPCTVNVIIRKTRTNGQSIQLCLEPLTNPDNHEFGGFTGLVVDLEPRHQRASSQLGISPA